MTALVSMQLARLADTDMIAEIHHLLWLPPFDNKGEWDEGWNCRDHALVTACLVALCGVSATILDGKTSIVDCGPVGSEPVCIEVSPHTFVGMLDCGILDFSIRFNTFTCHLRPVSWPVSCIIRNAPLPAGSCRVSVHNAPPGYERAAAEATHKLHSRSIIYLVQEGYRLTANDVEHAFELANSPLSDRLRDQMNFTSDIYAKAVLHLWDFLNGEATTLRNLTPDDAWRAVSRREGNAIWRVVSRASLG